MVRLLLLIALLPLISAVAFPALADQSAPPAAETELVKPATVKRVLIVVSPDCERCEEELKKLKAPGGPLEILRKRGWRVGTTPENHIQIVERSKPIDADIAKIVAELKPGNSPIVLCVENGEIARSFQKGCTTPLDQWTFGWLMTGNDNRPAEYVAEPVTVATTNHYRLRGNHWSVEGNFNPSKNEVARHLRAAHSNAIQVSWTIEDWSIEELRSLHDDVHEREEGFRGRYAATSATRSSSASRSGAGKPGSR